MTRAADPFDFDLDLDFEAPSIPPSELRKRPAPVWAVADRELRQADIDLEQSTYKGSEAEPIQRITQRHHMLARMLAAGTSPGEAALFCNYTQSRVSILQQSPAFIELVSLYKREVDEQFTTVIENMADLSADALEELRRRLEDEPDNFSNRELLALADSMLDRTGHGKQVKQEQTINVNLASRLEVARARAKQAALGHVIDDAEYSDETPE